MDSNRKQPRFLLSRNARITGAESELRRLHSSGEITRLRSGVYMRTPGWNALRYDDPYRYRVHAAAQVLRSEPQFSHDSAAVLWGLPSLGHWSRNVHILEGKASGGRSHTDIRRHCLGEDEAGTELDGLRVTSLARTLIDISCTNSFARAVGMLDHGLRPPESDEFRHALGVEPPTKSDLVELLRSLLPIPGSTKAFRAIEFADGHSGSLLESLSRTQFHLLGIPAPQLQVPFFDERGRIGDVDFFWPHLGLIGESDGGMKYDGANSPSGLPSNQVVKEEKNRENRMRRVSSGFVRWDWSTARDRRQLAAHVRPFGLVPLR